MNSNTEGVKICRDIVGETKYELKFFALFPIICIFLK